MTPEWTYYKGTYDYYIARTGQTTTHTIDGGYNFLDCNPCNYQGDHVTPNSFWYKTVRVSYHRGTIEEYYPSGATSVTTKRTGVIGQGMPQQHTWDRSLAYNAALARLNEGARYTADWAEDIAQANTTRKMFNLSETAADLAIKGVGFKRRLITGVSTLFLQTKYGWGPLLQNVFDSALAQYQDVTDGNVLLRYGATIPISSDYYRVSSSFGSGNLPIAHVTDTGKMGCRFNIYIKGGGNLQNNIGDFTTLNPVYLGWNLIPFSFVVDWFVNIGGYLEAAEKALKYKAMFHSGYVQELHAVKTVETVDNKTWIQAGSRMYVPFSRARRTHVEFQRTKLTSWPLPLPPGPEIDLGSSRLLAVAAFLGTFLEGKSPKPGNRRILKPSDLKWLANKALKVR